MASLQSYATTASNVVTDEGKRIITISNEVVEIDGALDDLPEKGAGWWIICRDGGGLRSTNGASGELGGGVMPLFITEESTANRHGNDNGNGNATNSRFGGLSTGTANTLKYSHIFWNIEGGTGNRSDFDIGTYASVEFNGVWLYQESSAGDRSGNGADFNHIYSTNFKISINERCGFGFRITHEGNGHAIIIEAQPNAQFAGLVVDNVTATTNNDGARVVVKPAGGTFTLFNLDTPSITESDSNSASQVILVNPKGVPTRTSDWSAFGSTMIVQRDVLFDFTGADADGNTLRALTAASSHGENATAVVSNGKATVRLRTDYSAYTGNQSGGTWTDTDSYRFDLLGRKHRKYYSGNTAIAVGDTPTTREVALTSTEFPDGTALTAYTGTDPVSTASEFFRVIKDYEQAHPDLPSLSESMAIINDDGEIVMGASIGVVLSTTASDLIDESSNILTIKVASGGLTADKGITAIDFGASTILQSGTKALLNLPHTDSSGASSQLSVSAHAGELAAVFSSDGTTKLGHHSFVSDGTWTLQINATNSTANIRIAITRKGYGGMSRLVDMSSGGTFSEAFEALSLIPGEDGTGQKYDSTANPGNLVVCEVVSTASSGVADYQDKEVGDCIVKVKAGNVSVDDVFKAYHDAVSAADGEGARAVAMRRQPLDSLSFTGQPGNLLLGPDCILRRFDVANGGQLLNAYPHGGIGGVAVDGPASAYISYNITVASCNQSLIDQKLVNMVDQLKLVCQSLPRHYYAPWTPGNPAVFFMRGQQRLHDVNKRNWGISNPDGNLLIEPITGFGDFDGNTRVEASLNRGTGDSLVNYAEECTLAFRIKPLDEDGTFILNELGAMRLRLVMSGGDGTLKVGHSGDNDYTHATIKAGLWNDIVLSIQRNPDNVNYPYVRLSATDGGYDGNRSPGVKAVQTWNIDSNDVFGSIASHTGAFYIGATANGFKGQIASCYFHPSETALNYVWETGDHKRAVGWDDYHQIWNGLPGDNSEGLSDDIVEDNVIRALARLASILEKLNHADIANAVLTQPFQAGWDATKADTDALGNFVKWLAANVNTTTPDNASAIAAASATATVGSAEFTKLAKESETTAGVVAGKASVVKDGERVSSSTFRDLADTKDVRTLTFGEDEDGERTASVEPQPPT